MSASLRELEKHSIEAVGISPDLPEKQMKFDQKHKLGFLLLSNPDNKIAKAYGAWGEKRQILPHILESPRPIE